MIACTAIAAALAAASPGSTVTATGACDTPLRIPARDYAGVTLDATAATFPAGAVITGASRLHIKGGTWGRADIDLPAQNTVAISGVADFAFTDATVLGNGDNRGGGLVIANSARVTLARNRFSGHQTGFAVRSSTNATVAHNVITGSTGDGFQLTDNSRVLAMFNRCEAFMPAEGSHPDCIQLRNLKDKPPQSDVTLFGNVAIGDMQGFFGDCNRTTFINNYAAVNRYHTVTCSGGAGNVAIGNVLSNTPASAHGPGSLKGFDAQWAARNVLWDARANGWAAMPLGVKP